MNEGSQEEQEYINDLDNGTTDDMFTINPDDMMKLLDQYDKEHKQIK